VPAPATVPEDPLPGEVGDRRVLQARTAGRHHWSAGSRRQQHIDAGQGCTG
jgi:hypothetical protein